MTPVGPAAATTALDAAYRGITAVVGGPDADLLAPTGCRGWLVVDLLLHVVCDAQRALVALATPVDGPADVDAVGYFRGTGDSTDDGAAHARWVRRSAAAFEHPGGVVRLWRDTAPAAVRAAAAADPAAFVGTQGHVLTVADLVATLVTEAAIHHLDLIAHLPGAPRPAPGALAVTLSLLDGLAGPDGLPRRWAPGEAVRKSTGRQPLSDADRATLGPRAAAFPLLS